MAKSAWTLDDLRNRAKASLDKHGEADPESFQKLANLLRYVDGDYNDQASFVRLRNELGDAKRPLHYLAIPPSLFAVVTEHLLIGARLFLGVAVGVASFTAPLYLSEISPQKVRGSLISLYQLMITIGILLAFLSNTWLASYATFGGVTGGHWRIMLGVIAVPAAIMFLGVLFLPESPRWLFLNGYKARALAVFKGMHLDEAETAAEVKGIEDNLKVKQNGFEMLKTNSNFPPGHWPWDWAASHPATYRHQCGDVFRADDFSYCGVRNRGASNPAYAREVLMTPNFGCGYATLGTIQANRLEGGDENGK